MRKLACQSGFGEIAVYDSEGDGEAAVMIHGNSLSAESYLPQLTGEPGERFRLFAFDLPGHGASAPARAPEQTYSFAGYARVLRDVTTALGLKKPVVVGHSLGGHMALQAVAGGFHVGALVLFGTPPLASPPDFAAAFHMEVIGDWLFKGSLTQEEVGLAAASFMQDGVEPPEYFARAIGATDPRAREFFGASLDAAPTSDEQAVLKNLSCPVAVFHGEGDQLINLAYLQAIEIPTLWRGSIQIIARAGHCPQYEGPEPFNQLLREFLSELPALS